MPPNKPPRKQLADAEAKIAMIIYHDVLGQWVVGSAEWQALRANFEPRPIARQIVNLIWQLVMNNPNAPCPHPDCPICAELDS